MYENTKKSNKSSYLRTNCIICAIQKRADILQVQTNAIHSSVVSDVAADKRSNQCTSELFVSDHQILKGGDLQLLLKLLEREREGLSSKSQKQKNIPHTVKIIFLCFVVVVFIFETGSYQAALVGLELIMQTWLALNTDLPVSLLPNVMFTGVSHNAEISLITNNLNTSRL